MRELPEGWQMLRLGDVSARTSNVEPSRTPAEEFELYSVPSFADKRPEIALGSEIKSAKQAVQPDDVLLCKIVPHINRVWVVGAGSDKRQIASGEWIVYRDHGCDPDYLRYSLTEQSFRDRFMQTVAGVGGSLMRARPSEVAEIKVPLAPLPEQRRIVAKIDSLTGKSRRTRDHLDHIPRLVEKYKQAVLDMAFADVPSRAPLSEQVEPERGIPYGIVQTGDPCDGGIPTIRCGDIKGFRVSRGELKLVNPEIESGFRRTRLRGGEVLIAIRGSVGETCVVPPELVDCNISREVAMIPLQECVVPDFIMYFLATTEAKRFILGNVKGVAQQGINLRDLKELPVPRGDTPTQREVVKRILTAFDWIDRLAADAASARKLIDQLDQAVLAKAFRGELVPQDPAEEPASVLMDRIRQVKEAVPKAKRGGRAI